MNHVFSDTILPLIAATAFRIISRGSTWAQVCPVTEPIGGPFSCGRHDDLHLSESCERPTYRK